jgi:hypothetical protein
VAHGVCAALWLEALSVLTLRDIDMTKIESRPMRRCVFGVCGCAQALRRRSMQGGGVHS